MACTCTSYKLQHILPNMITVPCFSHSEERWVDQFVSLQPLIDRMSVILIRYSIDRKPN